MNLFTPDGRYLVIRGRLWRASDPNLHNDERTKLVNQLMDARRCLTALGPPEERAAARRSVNDAKEALGERGVVWWTDGAPDYNRKMVRKTPYADWYASVNLR